jgi:hypothetical protein
MERNPTPERATVHANNHEKRPFRSIGRIRSLTKRLENGADGEVLEALHAEIVLLREENAQLRTKLERTPELGDVIEQMRALTMHGPAQKDAGDDAWHLLTEAVVMRDTLVDLCQRTREAMVALEGRLQQLEPLGAAASFETAKGGIDDHANGNGSLLAGANGVRATEGPAVSPVEAVASGWPPEGNRHPRSSNGHVTEDH